MAEPNQGPPRRRAPMRTRSSFLARTATDDAHSLDRRLSVLPSTPSPQREEPPMLVVPGEGDHETSRLITSEANGGKQYGGTDARSSSREHKDHSRTRGRETSGSRRRSGTQPRLEDSSLTAQMHMNSETKANGSHTYKPKPGSFPRPVGGSSKLGTFAGVFVPTSLNVLSILMFLRFGFILGQSGFLGMMGMLVVCYLINLITTLSISAIATNGTVRGGGAYYLISRSLGPEFGGSIGIVFYMGFVFNTGMNAVGLVDCLKQSFGDQHGTWAHWLPQGFWWQYLWASLALAICTAICLAGSGLFARASNGLLVILLISTFSIPFSAFLQKPFENRALGVQYTGISWQTFLGNLTPRFTKGADGSQLHGRESWQDLFGILFPATGGIFAGASMSGDLKHPSKAIPKGTLWALVMTFFTYTIVILAMALTVTRASFYRDVNIMQDVNVSGALILIGEIATTFFSSLMGVIGSAKLLQALARDHLIPGLSIFGQGTKGNDEPTYGIIITHIVAQLTMLSDINQLANFVTMTYLMTFLVTNLACFLLKIGSAPNFRPSFHYFHWGTAALGTVVSGATMFFVDGVYASGCVAILIAIFLVIHYTTPPKSWGDVSQSLIYHQVRKYLLRLKQEHVKFWRPQILLLVNDPRRQYKLIQFCNSLKKGSLFILGHVIVTPDFGSAVPEAKKQQAAWTKYIDFSKIKAFINVAISPAVEWGTRNIVLNSGLGGMRPNIVVMGFYNLTEYRMREPHIDVPSPQPSRPSSAVATPPKQRPNAARRKKTKKDLLAGQLPTDANRPEGSITAQSYVTILEDLLLRLQVNVAVAKGFQALELPAPKPSKSDRMLSMLHLRDVFEEENTKKYIDLWPIQMSAEISAEGREEGEHKRNVLTTNFDTYTLILQLGCILTTVPSWRRVYKLRVAVFVEYESDVEEERGRVETLLKNLRIEAEVLVFWLASGDLNTYEIIVNDNRKDADPVTERDVEETLKNEEWWKDVQSIRKEIEILANEDAAEAGTPGSLPHARALSIATLQQSAAVPPGDRFKRLRKLLRRSRNRRSMSGLNNLGVSLGMRTHSLDPGLIPRGEDDSDTSTSSSGSDSASESDEDSSDESRKSAASEGDIEDMESDDDPSTPVTPIRRRFSMGDSLLGPRPHKKGRSAHSSHHEDKRTDKGRLKGSKDSSAADSSIIEQSTSADIPTAPKPTDTGSRPVSRQSDAPIPTRPPVMRHQSLPKFTSKPVPHTTVSDVDGPGPSIMFTDRQTSTGGTQDLPQHPLSASPDPRKSIYTRSSDNGATVPFPTLPQQATGFPLQQSLPLSFNTLPCRAQHLILNELISRESSDTAVVFTTLPSPQEGTCRSEVDSVKYLSDLEVLCQGLPPVLLVHSNSMTVTMSL